MLTIFTIPKPFRGQIGVIQTNAIQSWLRLRPECEVILFGNDEGTAETAAKLGVKHVPDIERNEHGTPLVNSVFSAAQGMAKHQLMAYLNADIILMSDFLPAIGRVLMPSFLLIGQRWDINSEGPLAFNPDWEGRLRARLAGEGSLHGSSGLDYFVFPRDTRWDMPPFAIGRTAWDNWILYRARKLKLPLIDATEAVTVIHQNHDYSHNRQGESGVWKGPEAKRNLELAGGEEHCFSLYHATWILTPRDLKRPSTAAHRYYRLLAIPILFPRLHFLYRPIKAAMRVATVSATAFRRVLGKKS